MKTKLKSKTAILIYAIQCICVVLSFCHFAWAADMENYTYQLSVSDGDDTIWTTLPSERVFKNDAVPELGGDQVCVYAAKNEFEPIQVIIKPNRSKTVTVDISDFGSDIDVQISQVKYVEITQATDALGKTGQYPDPLWPLEKGEAVELVSNENTAFWITIHVPKTTPAGDYSAEFQIDAVSIPIALHVFDFAIPDQIHVKSQMNVSHNTILNKYGVSCCGSEYWRYVDKIKQYFIDHRLTPKSVLWSGGVTSSGAGPYIDYDCAGIISDNDEIWGFESPAARYLDGTGLMAGTFETMFNDGTGFPSFMAATFQNNDASADQRPSEFCGATRSDADWYTADSLDTAYNQKWFSYISSLEDYLSQTGYLDKAYYYIANEPQNQADYDAVAWYSQELKKVAPDLKLMVSEEARSEIYNHPDHTGSKIDIWLPVLNNYDPEIAHERASEFDEETWIYWLHGTRPPYFNPITLDHPGIESKFTGWFLWKYRIRGIAYYSMNNWGQNPWINPINDGHNGDLFMLYPPSQSNDAINYGENNHRFVPSIRFELMRDSLEDYEYLYVLNNSQQPEINTENTSDALADKIIMGTASYMRDSGFLYNLRRLIGLKNGLEIETIPDIQPDGNHPRSTGAPGNYYLNFQDPDESFDTIPHGNPVLKDEVIDGVTYKILAYDNKSYFAIGADAYDEEKGFGWYGNIINQPGERRDPWGNETDERKRTYVYDDWGRVNTFEFAVPNGEYSVSVCVGTPRKTYEHHNVTIEGIDFVNDAATDSSFILRTQLLTVSDNSLTIEIGLTGESEYTMLNYLHIETTATPLPLDMTTPDNFIILTEDQEIEPLESNKVTYVYGSPGANHITLESGAGAKLIHFSGSNTITIESAVTLFTVARSGAYVRFEGTDGTILVMPATPTAQVIEFDSGSLNIYLDTARHAIILEGNGTQVVELEPHPISVGNL